MLGTTRGWSYALSITLLAISVSPFYGPRRVFQFDEAFATPRALAEAGVLAALAALARAWQRIDTCRVIRCAARH